MTSLARLPGSTRVDPIGGLLIRSTAAAVMAASVLATSPLRAEERKPVPKASVGGGYAFLRTIERGWDDENLPRGFWVYGSAQLGPSLGLAFDFSRNVKTYGDYRGQPNDIAPRVEHDAIVLGPVFRFRSETRWTPFVHALAGVAWWRGESAYGSSSEADFLVQPGGGVDLRLHDRLSLRLQADLRAAFREEVMYQLRLAAGVSLHLGLEDPPAEPAEHPPLEIAFGYALTDDDAFGWLVRGFWLAPGVEIHPHLAIACEYSRLATDYDRYVSAWMIGPQVPFAIGNGRVTAFARFLAGRAERQYSCGDCTYQESGLAIQPGGGIDVSLSPYLAARFAVDYRVLFEEFEKTHLTRFAGGLVLRFGNAP